MNSSAQPPGSARVSRAASGVPPDAGFLESRESRRDFFRASGRCLGLGGLAALVLAGELKRRRLANSTDCIKLYTCADCIEFGGCSRPKAAEFRKQQTPS